MTSEELDEGRNVILENDDYIFMEILNSQTAKYYGTEYIAKNWGRKFRDGTLYYLINNKDCSKITKDKISISLNSLKSSYFGNTIANEGCNLKLLDNNGNPQITLTADTTGNAFNDGVQYTCYINPALPSDTKTIIKKYLPDCKEP